MIFNAAEKKITTPQKLAENTVFYTAFFTRTIKRQEAATEKQLKFQIDT
jgi:hypothetical protein